MLETFSNNFHAIKAPERVGQGNDYFMEPLKKAYSIDSKKRLLSWWIQMNPDEPLSDKEKMLRIYG